MGIGAALLQEGASAGFGSFAPVRGSTALANLPFALAAQVATQFKMSLLQLVEILQSKEPAYVRCIKPNDAKQPGRALPLPQACGGWVVPAGATGHPSLKVH